MILKHTVIEYHGRDTFRLVSTQKITILETFMILINWFSFSYISNLTDTLTSTWTLNHLKMFITITTFMPLFQSTNGKRLKPATHLHIYTCWNFVREYSFKIIERAINWLGQLAWLMYVVKQFWILNDVLYLVKLMFQFDIYAQSYIVVLFSYTYILLQSPWIKLAFLL